MSSAFRTFHLSIWALIGLGKSSASILGYFQTTWIIGGDNTFDQLVSSIFFQSIEEKKKTGQLRVESREKKDERERERKGKQERHRWKGRKRLKRTREGVGTNRPSSSLLYITLSFLFISSLCISFPFFFSLLNSILESQNDKPLLRKPLDLLYNLTIMTLSRNLLTRRRPRVPPHPGNIST